MTLALVVDNEPAGYGLDLFNREERALLWAWLFGEEVDAAFEAAVWMLCATQNDNGRPE